MRTDSVNTAYAFLLKIRQEKPYGDTSFSSADIKRVREETGIGLVDIRRAIWWHKTEDAVLSCESLEDVKKVLEKIVEHIA